MSQSVYTLDTDFLTELEVTDDNSEEESIRSFLETADVAIIPQSVYEELRIMENARKTVRKLDGSDYLERKHAIKEMKKLPRKHQTAVRQVVQEMRDLDGRSNKEKVKDVGDDVSEIKSGDISISVITISMFLTDRADTVTIVSNDVSLFEDTRHVVERYTDVNQDRVKRVTASDVFES